MNLLPSHRILAVALCLSLGACAAAESSSDTSRQAKAMAPAQSATTLPLMTVNKHESCGCCSVWIEHVEKAGFTVVAKNVDDMGSIKQSAGVPYTMGSCHTAEVGGYFVEGHVPAEDILRLLRERPDAKGLAVPGMPIGSPGMEHPDGRVQPYTVSLVLRDGSTREFSRHPRN